MGFVKKIGFLVALVAALGLCLKPILTRIAYEQQDTQVDTLLSLREAQTLANESGQTVVSFLSHLSQQKTLSSIILDEDTVSSAQSEGSLLVFSGSDLLTQKNQGLVLPKALSDQRIVAGCR